MGTCLVIINNLRRGLRHKLLFVVTFLLPLVSCIALGLVDFDKVSLRVGVLTGGSGVVAEKVITVLKSSEGITYALADPDTVNTDLMTGRFLAVLDCRKAKAEELRVITYQSEKHQKLLQSALLSAIEQGSSLKLAGWKQKGLDYTERTITLLLSLFSVFSVVYASALIRDKQNGTYLRYQFARKSGLGYVGGYIGYVFCITLVQVLLCMIALTLLQNKFALSLSEGICMAIVIAILSSLFSVIICLISKSEVKAGVIAASLCVLMSLLGGTFVAVEALPTLLRILSYLSPIRWVVELMGIL